jgi:hypothetical protein
MTIIEMTREIEYCCRVIKDSDDAYDALFAVVGCSPETDFCRSIFDLQDAIVNQTAKLINDNDGSLNWFVFESNFGKVGLEAKAEKWKRPRKIKTARELAKLIKASR